MSTVDRFKLALVCLATLGTAACVGVAGRPNAGTTAASDATGLAVLDVTPLSVNFGNVAAGTAAQQGVSIVNRGTARGKITQVTAKGAGFSVTGISVPLVIEAGESAKFIVDFSPGSSGAETGSISLTTSASDAPIVINLVGTGTNASVSVTPSSASFGDVVIGSDASQQMELKVSGAATIKITKVSTTGTGFSISGLAVPLTLSPGKSASFVAAFKPVAAGSESGKISITSTAEDSPLSVDLSGTGASHEASLSVTPTTLSFGGVAIGKSTSEEVTLKSTGNADVDISRVSVTGSGFSVSGGGSNVSLAPGQHMAITVKFDPSKSGNATGAVIVASNASNSPAKISLSGWAATSTTSTATVQHTVTLHWAASASSSVVGYYVYRGILAAGPFLKLNAASEASTNFTDAAVFGGQTYYYVVTAVDSGRTESAFSSQVAVTIPDP